MEHQTRKRPSATTSNIHDHQYSKKLKTKFNINDEFTLCKESVEILKEIKQTLSSGLADICAKLGELNETLKRQ